MLSVVEEELSSGLFSVVELEELSELLEAVDDEDDVVDEDEADDDDDEVDVVDDDEVDVVDDDEVDVDDVLLEDVPLEDEFPFPLHAVSAAAIRTAVIAAVILLIFSIFFLRYF